MVNDPLTTSASDVANIKPILTITGQELKKLIDAALNWLRANQQMINSLNVFPVPDGDTGTNMLLTMQSAWNEIAELDDMNVGKIARAISQGALMGARGNSGVILSQLWRGFARVLDNLDLMDAPTFVAAIIESRNTAYKGVVRPVEGTILTVAKDCATAAEESNQQTNDLLTILEKIVDAADASVQYTPELLPILKQAGVVDSGGKGLFIILEGMLRYVLGQSLDASAATIQPIAALNLENAASSIEPGQDYEIVIDFQPKPDFQMESFFENLSSMGTSIQIGEGEGMYRMHIHVPTEKRYEPIDYTMSQGIITKIAIENLLEQLNAKKQGTEIIYPKVQPNEIAVVAISPGFGISKIFASLGAAAIVEGGQTMNPSTEEILKAIDDLPTDKVVILPNNKNIILAAQSAASMTKKNVRVVPCINVPQGLSAILRLDPEGNLDDLHRKMVESLQEVETGEITTATRSVEINDVNVKEGQVIVLHNGKLIGSYSNLEEACMKFLENAGAKEKERITLFYGKNIIKADVENLVVKIKVEYPSHEVEIHEGGQPYYQFIISIE